MKLLSPGGSREPAEADPRVLDAYAARADHVPWDVVDGRVVIGVPKRYTRIERWVARWFPGPDTVFVTLDDVGTTAWLAADGSRRVRDIADALVAAFGEDASPADVRASRFFTNLVRKGFARLYEAPRATADAGRGFTEANGYRALDCRKCARSHPVRAAPGARYLCPRCSAVNRVP